MKIFRYVIEWFLSFIVIGGLNYLANLLFSKKFNPITSAVFSFVVVGFTVFYIAPFVITFPYPVYVYLPFLIFFFVWTLYKITKV